MKMNERENGGRKKDPMNTLQLENKGKKEKRDGKT